MSKREDLLQIKVSSNNKVKQKAKYRDEDGLTKREKAKLEKIEGIKKLKEKGMTYGQISNELNFSINTIKRYSSKYIK